MIRLILPLLLFSVGVSGLLWSNPELVSNATSFTATGNSSQLILVWEDQSLLYQRTSYNNGSTWNTTPLFPGKSPKIKMSLNGTLILIYSSGNSTVIIRNNLTVAEFPGTSPMNYTLAVEISQNWAGCWEDQGTIYCTSSTNDGLNWTISYSIVTGSRPSIRKGDNYWTMYFYQYGHLYYYYGSIPTWTLYGPAKMNVPSAPISEMASNGTIMAAVFGGGFMSTTIANSISTPVITQPINSTYTSLSYTGLWTMVGGDQEFRSYWSNDLVVWNSDPIDSQFSEYHQKQLVSLSSDAHIALFLNGNGSLWLTRSFIQPVPISSPSPILPSPSPMIIEPSPSPMIIDPSPVPLTLISVDTQINGSIILEGSLILQANLTILGNLNLTNQSSLEFSGNGTIQVNGSVTFGGQLIVTGGPQTLMTFGSSSGTFSNVSVSPCHVLNYSQSSLSLIFDLECSPGSSGIPLWAYIVMGSAGAALLIALVVGLIFFRKQIFPHRKRTREAFAHLQQVQSRQSLPKRRDRA